MATEKTIMCGEYDKERDIDLTNPPLVEAWIEIRWELQPGEPPQMRDPGYLFALGPFHEYVKGDFPIRKELPNANIPEQLTPHHVRHQFIKGDETALFQFGPGVATANVLQNYTRQYFFELIETLRKGLVHSYQTEYLKAETVILRYRNVEPFDFSSNDVLSFIEENLNTSFRLPSSIPGPCSTEASGSADLRLSFDLLEPNGTGSLRIVTGTKSESDEEGNILEESEVILWELSVSSTKDAVPLIEDEEVFKKWLIDANNVIHGWFFALVEGYLLDKYR